MKLALFDIDGVLADDRHRVHFALDRNWAAYFNKARMSADTVWPEGREVLLDREAEGWTIAYMTGRRDERRYITEDWLMDNDFPWGRVIMREFENSSIPLANLKANQVEKLVRSGRFEDVVLYDDDPEVIRVVQQRVGESHAIHCTWHVKEKALVRKATA